MSDAIRSKIIRAEIVCAYSHCPRKAFLLHCTEERGTPHEYAGIVEERTKVNRTRYLAALQQTSTSVCSYSDGGISSGIDVLMEAHLTAADLEVYCDVLTRVSSARREDAVEYEPTIIVGTSGIEKEHLVNRAPVIAEVDLGQKRGAVAEHPCRHDWVLLIGGIGGGFGQQRQEMTMGFGKIRQQLGGLAAKATDFPSQAFHVPFTSRVGRGEAGSA